MKYYKLPDRALEIAEKLQEIGRATPKELKSQFPDISSKDFDYCIKRLHKFGIIKSIPFLSSLDMRMVHYRLAYPHELEIREEDIEPTLLTQILEVIQNANN